MSGINPLSLYAIDSELLALEDVLLEAGGELTEEIEAQHDYLLDVRDSKVEGYLRVIRRLEATAEAIKAERQRLQEAERSMANAPQALKDRLARSMQQYGDQEYLTSLGRIKLQRRGTVPIELLVEVDVLPDEFVRINRSPDLTALREALQSEDAAQRAEAERMARLGVATHYVRVY